MENKEKFAKLVPINSLEQGVSEAKIVNMPELQKEANMFLGWDKSEVLSPINNNAETLKQENAAFKNAIVRGFDEAIAKNEPCDIVRVNEAKVFALDPLSQAMQKSASNVR